MALHYTTTTTTRRCTTTTFTLLHTHYATLYYTRVHSPTVHYTTVRYATLHYTTLQLQLHYTNCTTLQLKLHYTTTTTTTALHHTASSSCGWGDHRNHCNHSKKRNSSHLSVHQWIRSAIRDSQQPTSPIGFLFLKLPPPPCAAPLVF